MSSNLDETPAIASRLTPRFVTTGRALAVSRLSGKTVIENTNDDCFLIPASWSQAKCAAAVEHWKTGGRDKTHKYWTRAFIAKVDALSQIASRKLLCEALEGFLPEPGEAEEEKIADNFRPCIVELFIALWSHECLIWPRTGGPLKSAVIKSVSRSWGASRDLIQQTIAAFAASDDRQTCVRFRSFAKFLLSRSPPTCISDICPHSEQKVLKSHERNAFTGAVSGVIRLQREAAPRAELYTSRDFVLSAPAPSRTDPAFGWAIGKRPGIEIWAREAAAFLETKMAGRERAISALNFWLDYMLDNANVPANPMELFDSSKRATYPSLPSGARHQTKVNATISEFLSFVMDRHCSIDEDNGHRFVPAMFRNPIGVPPPPRNANYVETPRVPMPTRMINLCVQILTENDFAWPKRKTTRSADWFKWRNPESGKLEKIWSPVCAYAILIKLLLPMRTFQLRMLDSGEADTERYEADGKSWSPNSGSLAPKSAGARSKVEKGVFRKYQRKDGTTGSLLFFNTNKTADIDQPAHRRGYVMPWEHEQALTLFADLRDWQETHNKIAAPTAWAGIPELSTRHPDELAAMGAACFLFRDPTNASDPGRPITDGKLSGLWLALMDEAESRLRMAGEKSAGGGEIKLVAERGDYSKPLKAIFDLHSLRVTIITALFEQGMPPEFIMKIVGHASVLMTLYYVKIHSEDIALAINKAEIKRQEASQDQWLAYLEKFDAADLKPLVAHCHESGLSALSSSNAAGMLTMSHGICPVAGRRCAEGLAVDGAAAGAFTAVPGLSSNCVSCRFFVTGPAFLIGLEAHFNDLAYRARGAALAYQEAQEAFDTLLDQRSLATETGVPFEFGRQLRKAESGAEIATMRTDELAMRMHATYRLVEQCIKIASAPAPDEKFSLVLAPGGVDTLCAALTETHELEQLQKVCESAVLFEDLQIDSTRPNLERMRFFDRMLSDAGLKPAFSLIRDDAVAQRVANEMGRVLYASYTSRQVADLADGRVTLSELGFDKFPHELKIERPKNVLWLSSANSDAPGQTGGVNDQRRA